jgi:pimeloyl-ACP methyl ester carboxylesterase
MRQVRSKDGTIIAYDRYGSGPSVILVSGALSDRGAAKPLAALLAPHLMVIAYGSRGRGDSGDTAPYAVEREIEDIDALIKAVGGSASLYGHSSGTALALEAAAAGLAISNLALCEPPYIVDDSRPPLASDYRARLTDLIATDRNAEAVELLLSEAVGVPAGILAQMRGAPMWKAMEITAPTLLYHREFTEGKMRGHPLPAAQWASVTQPILVIDGGASPPWRRHAAQGVAAVLRNGTYRTLEGQTHATDPAMVAPVLVEFFRGEWVAKRSLRSPCRALKEAGDEKTDHVEHGYAGWAV